MYPGNRPNLAASNMQGSVNSENAMNFNLGNARNFNFGNATSNGSSGLYMHGRMAAGGLGSAERTPAQAPIGNFCPHPAVHVGSEAEHIPHCGNGVGGLAENTYGRANHFTDIGRRSCKRKNLEGSSGHPSYDGPSHSFSQQRGGSSRFTVPSRYDMGNASSFSTLAVTPASARNWEERVMPMPDLMGGLNIASDYRSTGLSVPGIIEGPRSVRSRSNPTYHEEQFLPHLQPLGNNVWHVQPRSSPAEQLNMDPAATNANANLHDMCQFPWSSVLQRRSLVPDERIENMPTVSSHFGFNAMGRERPSSLHVETSSSSMMLGVPNQGRHMSGTDNRISNDLSNWAPINRNLSGVPYADQMCANPINSSRATVPWYPPQHLHMPVARTSSGVAQGSASSLRSGQSNHFARSSGGLSFIPSDMAINPETSLQGPNYLRSSWMERRSDRNVRPLARSFLDISIERLQTLQNEDDRHNGIISEDVLLFDQSFYGAVDLHDRHRAMRLDVDNMTYEELLALGERIGNVSTGLTENSIPKCLKIRKFSSVTESSAVDETSQKCSICQEEYEDNEELGTLECGHDHHTECIKKWLLQKNECPICKASALKT